MGLIERKKAILLNEPHLETASGSVASFFADREGIINSLTITMPFTQTGSGDVLPSNIRPILGGNSLTIYHSATQTGQGQNIALPINVYGGTIDIVNGVLIAEWVDFPISRIYHSSKLSYAEQISITTTSPDGITAARIKSDRVSANNPTGTVGRMSWYNNVLYANLPLEQFNSYDSAGVLEWYEEYKPQFVLQLATPQVYQISPQILKTLRGDNYIWSDSGTVTVKYWTH